MSAAIYVLPPPKGKIVCVAMCSEHDEYSDNVDPSSKISSKTKSKWKIIKNKCPFLLKPQHRKKSPFYKVNPFVLLGACSPQSYLPRGSFHQYVLHPHVTEGGSWYIQPICFTFEAETYGSWFARRNLTRWMTAPGRELMSRVCATLLSPEIKAAPFLCCICHRQGAT